MSLGRQIQIARVIKGWKQQDLRKATGLSQKHLSQIENDAAEPGVEVLKRICMALELSPAQVYDLLELPRRRGTFGRRTYEDSEETAAPRV